MVTNGRTHILFAEKIPRPTNMLHVNPSFAELAFYYLSLDECRNHSNINNITPPGPEISILNKYHYDCLRSLCPKKMLNTTWKEWKRLGEFKHGEKQRFSQHTEACSMKERYELYQEVWKGTQGTREEYYEFLDDCMAKGSDEIEEILSKGTKWKDIKWVMFDDYLDLYERLPTLGLYQEMCEKHPEKCLGPRIYFHHGLHSA